MPITHTHRTHNTSLMQVEQNVCSGCVCITYAVAHVHCAANHSRCVCVCIETYYMRLKDGDRLRVGKTLSLFLSVSFVPIYEKSRGRGNFSRTKMPAMLQAVRSVQLVFTSFSFRCCRASKYFFLSENGCRGHTHTQPDTFSICTYGDDRICSATI